MRYEETGTPGYFQIIQQDGAQIDAAARGRSCPIAMAL
jgi:hypothetical protein